MAIPSYTYFNLKKPGPVGIITMEAKVQRALDGEQNIIELAVATKHRDLCLNAPPSLANLTMLSTSSAFKAVEDTKAIQINTEDPAKTIQIGASLSPK
jgi:hypothetical protein